MTRPGREYPERPLVGVGVMLFRAARADWQILLVRRGLAPAEGRWSLPGGAQRLGETAEAAARRELAEETGLVAGPLHLAAYADSIERDAAGRVRFHYTILDFAGRYQGGAAVAGGDARAVVWASAGDFGLLEVLPDMQRVIAAGWAVIG